MGLGNHRTENSLSVNDRCFGFYYLCEECHWEFHRHFETVKSHEYVTETPKYTELIGLWEVLNDPLSMKEFKELVYKGLYLKRNVQKSFNEEEIEANNKQLK
ncbi:hypothetical protein EXW52_04960 [Bacillus mycoides]|uniref:hypothetical protein n=1 Tax=Bacillus mycoides TaxID=1405 RepID=UPI001C01E069|nr:hypothetical protein [Bacillus mycoides]QWG99585.1 hypothetical protein EXW52_04960 [Bacillus mycoides]